MPKLASADQSLCALIFDGDDTLWSTEPLYDSARANARALVKLAGLDGEEWEAIERKIDVERVLTHGFAKNRFPESCVRAYEELAARHGRPPEPDLAGQIRRAGEQVFMQRPALISGSARVLQRLTACGFPLALVTKGDPEVQRRRISQSRLSKYFQTIEIVPEKTPDVIRRTVVSMGAEPSASWMIGNSIPSDIIPALEAGLKAIWVNAHVWEYERVDEFSHDRVMPAFSLDEVPKIVTVN